MGQMRVIMDSFWTYTVISCTEQILLDSWDDTQLVPKSQGQ